MWTPIHSHAPRRPSPTNRFTADQGQVPRRGCVSRAPLPHWNGSQGTPQRSSWTHHLTLLCRRETEARCLSGFAQGHSEFVAELPLGS